MTRLMLNRALQSMQQKNGGYLDRTELLQLSEQSGVPLYHLEGLIGFFPHYRLEAPPEYTVHVCHDMTCHLRGAKQVLESLEQVAKTAGHGKVHVEFDSCLGR